MKYLYNVFNKNEFESHRLAYNLIDSNSKVLDLGCATGYFGKELRIKKCKTWGVEVDKRAALVAKKYYERVEILNLNEVQKLPFPKKYFDYVILLDVIEHLLYPEKVLSAIKPYLKKDGRLIVSVPNIAHASVRWMLLKGNFVYTSTGILDDTHLRFYTKKSFSDTLKKNGFKILKLLPTNGMCKVPFLYKVTDRLPELWQYWIACKMPTLFSFQFIALAKIR